MLVLSRRLNEKIVIPSIHTTVQVVGIKAGAVRLGIVAPPDVPVWREEVQDRRVEGAGAAPAPAGAEARLKQVNQLVRSRLAIGHTGLELLRHQLRQGLTREAADTLERLDEDLEMLRRRLEQGDREPPKPPPPGRRQALLVEDNANERELLATFLRISGLDVVTAGDGADALKYLHTHAQPDLVLLDMGLPRCDGPTVVRELRRDPTYAGLKIFAVTGHGPEEYDLGDGPRGVNRWFQKPIDPHELVRTLGFELNRSPCRV